jgi:uncharacterized Fe-S cluster-containing MiaB family protein
MTSQSLFLSVIFKMTHNVIRRDTVSQVLSRNASYDPPMTLHLKVILRNSVSQVLRRNASYDFAMTFPVGHFQNDSQYHSEILFLKC